MTRNEFVDSLRRNISSVSDYRFINDTIEYYQDYIDSEMRKGRSETEVMEELGDPRLIAKSILASRNINPVDGTEEPSSTEEEDKNVHINTLKGRNLVVPAWLFKVGAIVLGVTAVVVVGFITIKLMPVICVAVLAVLFYRFFRDNFLR